MRDEYKEEADAVARKHGLDHDLIDEIDLRGLKVVPSNRADYEAPFNQAVSLQDAEGNEVAYKISDHPGRAVIAALDEILTNERAQGS